MKKLSLFAFVFCFAFTAPAQEVLTVEQAIEIGLKNNYDIQIARNRVTIADLNNTPGNAGMLPSVNATLSDNATYNSLNQKFSNGLEVNTAGVTGNNLNASVNVSWTLFDGLRMFAAKGRLRRLEEISELNYKDTLQAAVGQILVAYYDIVSTKQQLVATEGNTLIFEERAKIAETSFNVGASSKLDFLQAKVDWNESRSAALTQRNLLEQKKAELNRIISRPAETEFEVSDSIPFNFEPHIGDPGELDSKNFQLLAAVKNVEIARQIKKETFAGFLPTLTALGAYGFGRTQSTAGFSLYNQSYGPSGGFVLNIPLFNGLNTINQNKIAGIQITNTQFALERTRLQVKLNYYRALKDFQYAKQILALEEENIKLAEENQRIALERFRLAQSTAFEAREAQRSYVAAQTRVVQARFNAKEAETELMRIQGELVK